MSGTLYVAATPIGNREDFTDRARRVLSECPVIAAEDTRVAKTFLQSLGLYRGQRLVSNHKFSEERRKEELLSCLRAGQDVALISDAGTPCVSDPGYILVRAAAAEGIPVTGVCGADAVVTALSVSGFPCPPYAFYGFLPRRAADIREAVTEHGAVGVWVYFESPKRILKTMDVLTDAAGTAEVCLCNDLTKRHERIYRGTPADVGAELAANPAAEKGEYTMVVRYPPREENAAVETGEAVGPEARLLDYMLKHGAGAKEAVSALAGKAGTKNELYRASLRLREALSGYGKEEGRRADRE